MLVEHFSLKSDPYLYGPIVAVGLSAFISALSITVTASKGWPDLTTLSPFGADACLILAQSAAPVEREAVTLPLDHAFGVELADVTAAIEVLAMPTR